MRKLLKLVNSERITAALNYPDERSPDLPPIPPAQGRRLSIFLQRPGSALTEPLLASQGWGINRSKKAPIAMNRIIAVNFGNAWNARPLTVS